MEHIGSKVSPDSKLQIQLTCSIGTLNILKVIEKTSFLKIENAQPCSSQLAVLLPQLANLQDSRLTAPNRPPELIGQLDQVELRTAGQVQRGLLTALKKLAPGVAYDTNALRKGDPDFSTFYSRKILYSRVRK